MNFSISQFLNKLQNLPDNQKKIILWTIVIILGLIMGFFWFQSAINSFSKIGKDIGQIKLPEVQSPEINILQTTSQSDQNITK